MPTNEELGIRVREAREALGLSQAELGRLLTRSRTHAAVSDIERNKTKLTIEELSDLARVLGKDLAYFYTTESAPSVVYRRSERGLPPDKQHAADQAVEAFKQFARLHARRPSHEGPP